MAGGTRKASATARRRAARLAAVQALYQIELTSDPADAVARKFLEHRLGRERDDEIEADQSLFADIVQGVASRRRELDALIASVLVEGWTVERLELVLKLILRAGAYELQARPDVPARVCITEYVDLAHAFFDGKEPGLTNGVLDRLARMLRPDEMGLLRRERQKTTG